MNSYIIVGSPEARGKYIDTFLADKKVPSYNVIRIVEIVKIAVAREIKKHLSISSGGIPRVIIIPQDITPDAQNALLKTVEELPENTFVLFESISRDALLPTIVSRCSIIILEAEILNLNDGLQGMLRDILHEENIASRIGLAMKFIDSLGTITDDHIKSIILDLRAIILKDVLSNQKNTFKSLTVINSMSEYFLLCQNNNVNKRMMLEAVFLSQNWGLDKNPNL